MPVGNKSAYLRAVQDKIKKKKKKKKVVRPVPLKSEKVDRKAYYKKFGHLHPDKTSLDYEGKYRETGKAPPKPKPKPKRTAAERAARNKEVRDRYRKYDRQPKVIIKRLKKKVVKVLKKKKKK